MSGENQTVSTINAVKVSKGHNLNAFEVITKALQELIVY